MAKFMLNDKTKRSLEKTTGLSYNKLVELSASEIDKHLEAKSKKHFKLSSNYGNLIGRGSVYLYLNRLIDKNVIEKKLSRI